MFSEFRTRHREFVKVRSLENIVPLSHSFVQKVHSFRYPLSQPWRILATACYMSIPLLIAYPLWFWVESNSKSAKERLMEAQRSRSE
jgi:hypothetical protein